MNCCISVGEEGIGAPKIYIFMFAYIDFTLSQFSEFLFGVILDCHPPI